MVLLWHSSCICKGCRFSKIKCNLERNEDMNTVLQLQKLMPTASTGEMSILFVSTYSNICPTTGLPGEGGQFEMQ
jgi:hypothetical protein